MFNGTYGFDGGAIYCEIPDSATFADNIFLNSFSKSLGSTISVVSPKCDVIETGTHKELMDKKGRYYNLFISQYDR